MSNKRYADLDELIRTLHEHKMSFNAEDRYSSYGMGFSEAFKLVCLTYPDEHATTVPDREQLMGVLSRYFSVGDSYTYELTRAKSAFWVGTVDLEDFEEWGEEKVADLCDYLMKNLFGSTTDCDKGADADGL